MLTMCACLPGAFTLARLVPGVHRVTVLGEVVLVAGPAVGAAGIDVDIAVALPQHLGEVLLGHVGDVHADDHARRVGGEREHVANLELAVGRAAQRLRDELAPIVAQDEVAHAVDVDEVAGRVGEDVLRGDVGAAGGLVEDRVAFLRVADREGRCGSVLKIAPVPTHRAGPGLVRPTRTRRLSFAVFQPDQEHEQDARINGRCSRAPPGSIPSRLKRRDQRRGSRSALLAGQASSCRSGCTMAANEIGPGSPWQIKAPQYATPRPDARSSS